MPSELKLEVRNQADGTVRLGDGSGAVPATEARTCGECKDGGDSRDA